MNAITVLPCDEGVIRAGPQAFDCSAKARHWILVTMIVASSMAFIDATVVNVALPALQQQLRATVADIQWVVESYALVLAAFLLLGGAAGDHFGRRRVFSIGVALFGAASLWCGLARSVEELIVARALQGAGAALMVPGSLAILSAAFPLGERGRAIGTWSAMTAIMSAAGPVLGGLLIDHFSWRYVFVINVPLAVVVLSLTAKYVPPRREGGASGARLDWPGAILAGVALSGLVFALIESSTIGWSHPAVLVAAGAGIAALIAFIGVEARRTAPMLPLDLFHSRTFSGANLLTLLLYAALGGALFFVPLNLIQVQHYSTVAAGAALLPFTLMLVLLSRSAGRVADRYGARLPLTVGSFIAGIGFALFALPGVGGSYWVTFFPAVAVLGLGMAICVAPLTTTVMNAVPPARIGIASGVNNAFARVAGLLAIALFGVLMSRAFDAGLMARIGDIAAPEAALRLVIDQRERMAAIPIPQDLAEATRTALSRAVEASFGSAFRRVMLASAALAIGAALVAWFTIDGRTTATGGAARAGGTVA